MHVAADPADFPFLSFVSAVGSHFDSTLLFGRRARRRASDEISLLPAGIGLVELPSYDSLLRIDQVVRATPGTVVGFWRGLSQVDAVWVLGPHPFAFLIVGLGVLRGKGVVLGVRQDTLAYFRSRLPSSRWKVALLAVQVWHLGFRALARVLRITVVGEELSRAYAGEATRLLPMTVSLIRDADVVSSPPQRDWTGTINLLSVGRIDQEKNPLLLVEAMASLERRRPHRYRLLWVGTGPLEEAVSNHAMTLGVSERIELLGFVPFGPELLDRYRQAHVFVHVSLTEGVPAVLIEALASGTPVVATAVGGVAAALDHGRAGLLVRPSDRDALVAALLRIVDDDAERDSLVRRGLQFARERTLETEAARVARFIKDAEALRGSVA
jgi:glycosyltransferase involved in cell wall biosynthesis